MSLPWRHIGGGITVQLTEDGFYELRFRGTVIFLSGETIYALNKFHAYAQTEMASRQSLEPAYQFINQTKQ